MQDIPVNESIVPPQDKDIVRFNAWARFVTWLRRRDEARRSRRALDWLSENELRDVGLTRDGESGAYRRARSVGNDG